MLYFHYVITTYHPETHQPIGRNSGIQAAQNGTNPIKAHSSMVEQFGERLASMPGVVPNAYFIISPYTLMAMDDEQMQDVGAPRPMTAEEIDLMQQAASSVGMDVKPSFAESKPGEFYLDQHGQAQYHAHGMEEPQPCPRCGTVSHRPDGSHYCNHGWVSEQSETQEIHSGMAGLEGSEWQQESREGKAIDSTPSKGLSTADAIRAHFQAKANSTDAERTVQCDGCWYEASVSDWIENDGECPECNTSHAHLASPQ